MATANAINVRTWTEKRNKSVAAVIGGQVRQQPNGKAGIVQGLNNALMVAGVNLTESIADVYQLPKATGVVLLDGGNAYFSLTNQNVSYKRTGNLDPWIGTIVGDCTSASTTCLVNLNQAQQNVLDVSRDSFVSVIVGTQALSTMGLFNRGGYDMLLAATNEAEKVDILSADAFSLTALQTGFIVELAFNLIADDSATNAVFSIGLGDTSHATAYTSIANYIGFQAKAADGKIYAGSKNTGGVTVAMTDTTKASTVGTRMECWIDARLPAATVMYVNGVQVLAATVFDISFFAAGAWKLISHLVKTATTDTMEVRTDWLRARQMSL
jgi:hypothetical protein